MLSFVSLDRLVSNLHGLDVENGTSLSAPVSGVFVFSSTCPSDGKVSCISGISVTVCGIVSSADTSAI